MLSICADGVQLARHGWSAGAASTTLAAAVCGACLSLVQMPLSRSPLVGNSPQSKSLAGKGMTGHWGSSSRTYLSGRRLETRRSWAQPGCSASRTAAALRLASRSRVSTLCCDVRQPTAAGMPPPPPPPHPRVHTLGLCRTSGLTSCRIHKSNSLTVGGSRPQHVPANLSFTLA